MKPTDILDAVAAVTGLDAASIIAGRGRAAQRARMLTALMMQEAGLSNRATARALGVQPYAMPRALMRARELVAGPFYAVRYREARERLAPLAARVWEAAS
jgi:hypothetical protein